VAHGVDLRVLPLDRFCNFVWWAVTHEGAENEVQRFRARLWMPPPGTVVIPAKSPWSAENEMSAFGALRAQLGGKHVKE
jgi:hypothetical protein